MENNKLNKVIGIYQTYFFDKSVWGEICRVFDITKKESSVYISNWILTQNNTESAKVSCLEHLTW